MNLLNHLLPISPPPTGGSSPSKMQPPDKKKFEKEVGVITQEIKEKEAKLVSFAFSSSYDFIVGCDGIIVAVSKLWKEHIRDDFHSFPFHEGKNQQGYSHSKV